MSRYLTSHRIDGPFIDADPVAELVRFYRANGYSLESEEGGPTPSGLSLVSSSEADSGDNEEAEEQHSGDNEEAEEQDSGDNEEAEEQDSGNNEDTDQDREIVISARLTRGKPGASVWTSNMAELRAVLDLELLGNVIKIDYDIETTMQHFTDEDRAFWEKEARKAGSFVTGKVDAIIDWRENESIRIERQQKDIVLFGLQMMVISAIIAAILYFAFV